MLNIRNIKKRHGRMNPKLYVALSTGLAPTGILLMNTAQALADTTHTGWDTHDTTASTSDMNNSQNNSDAQKNANNSSNSKNDDANKNAEKQSSESKTGWLDVYVDHSNLDSAKDYALSHGLNVNHEDTQIQMGDANATQTNTDNAKKYYQDTANDIRQKSDQYATDMSNYNAAVAQQKQTVDNANASIDALKSNMATLGQTVNLVSKEYSQNEYNSDVQRIQDHINDGRQYKTAVSATEGAQQSINNMTLFQTAQAQGDIHLSTRVVTVSSQADADNAINQAQTDYQNLQNYLNNRRTQTGSIPDDQKPSFVIPTFVVDSNLQNKALAPIEIPHFYGATITKPVQPTVNYHYYDIRSQMTANSEYDNKDGQTIPANQGRNTTASMAQALKGQTVGVQSDNQPMPSQRFDKIQDLTIETKIPDGATYNKALTDTDPTNWTVSYNEETRILTQTATARYLVQVNLNQDKNNARTVGGTTDGQWLYKAPRVFFSLDNDDKVYQTHSTAIINKEYMYEAPGIYVKTTSATPSKVNLNGSAQVIDGKAVLPGTTNHYFVRWDFTGDKNTVLDNDMANHGTRIVDDFPDGAVQPQGPLQLVDPTTGQVMFQADVANNATVGASRTFKDDQGHDVQGLTWKIASADQMGDAWKGKLNGNVLVVENVGNNSFYQNFVRQGRSLSVSMPMVTLQQQGKDGQYAGVKYTNKAFQDDFGNIYETNGVDNDIPSFNPQKDAVKSFANLGSYDLNNNPQAKIANGDHFDYSLNGTQFKNNLAEGIKSYEMVDMMDQEADEYSGAYNVLTKGMVYFQAGSTLAARYPNGLPAGSDMAKYITQTVTRNSGNQNLSKIVWSVDSDFLNQIDYSKTEFGLDLLADTKRIKEKQGVTNVYFENVNGIQYASNVVTTNTDKSALDKLTDIINANRAKEEADKADSDKKASDNKAAVDKAQASADQAQKSADQAQKTADADAQKIVDLNKDFTSRLAVVVNNLENTKKDVNQKVDDINQKVSQDEDALTKNSIAIWNLQHALAIVQNDVNTNTNKLAEVAQKVIVDNAKNPSNTDVVKAITNIDDTNAQLNTNAKTAIAGIFADFNQKQGEAQKSNNQAVANASVSTSQTVIWDNSVKSVADAKTFMSNLGVHDDQIVSVAVDDARHFTVNYRN